MKRVAVPNVVIVLTNHAPDSTRLSDDRYRVWSVSRDNTTRYELDHGRFIPADAPFSLNPVCLPLNPDEERKRKRDQDDDRKSELLYKQWTKVCCE